MDDDDDDYFKDSLVLDENDLALLQEEEDKYASAQEVPAVEVPPSPKRQKTRHDTEMDMVYETPEIILRNDGTYGVRNDVEEVNGRYRQLATPTLLKANDAPQRLRNIQATVKPAAPQRSTAVSIVSSQSRWPTQEVRDASRTLVEAPRPAAREDPHIQEEMAILRKQLEDLNRAYSTAQTDLKNAENSRFAKEGELTFLRRSLAKAEDESKAQREKLREMKEAAEAKQSQLQKEMKEELERLRTEFVFKQHEFDSSTRKPTWSTRTRRLGLAPQQSPVPLSAAMKTWTAPIGESGLLKGSPSRARTLPSAKSPLKPRVAAEPAFRGFENSFLPASPRRSPLTRSSRTAGLEESTNRSPSRGRKGKERVLGEAAGSADVFSTTPARPMLRRRQSRDDAIQDFEMDSETPQREPIKGGTSPIPESGDRSSVVDFDIAVDDERDHYSSDHSVVDGFEGINWRDEFHFLLFTHTSEIAKETHTFQNLLSVSIPIETAPEQRQVYLRACSSILEALGTKFLYDTLENLMSSVSASLIAMACVLLAIESLDPLTTLFELLTSLMIYIPQFTSTLLKSSASLRDGHPKILGMLCDTIRIHLRPREQGKTEDILAYAAATLTVLETICWTVAKEDSDSLVTVARSDKVLLTLLDSKQSDRVISHTLRILVVLASHSCVTQSLLSVANSESRPEDGKSRDDSRIPLVERLCGLLADSYSSGSEKTENLQLILSFFSLLRSGNPEAHSTLLRSYTLIPSLVHLLTGLAKLVWEDDEETMESSSKASSTVHLIIQALQLLHQLVITPESSYDLRHKLYHASQDLFNGLAHMFVVMIGRLSFADAPDWFSPDLQAALEQVTEPARDLMDLVYEGPEGESVWAAYQTADAEDSVTEEDDDEMEARLLDPIDAD